MKKGTKTYYLKVYIVIFLHGYQLFIFVTFLFDFFYRKEPIRSSRIQPSTDYMNQAPPPPNITSSRHRYEQHSSDSRRMRQSPPPPPPPASRPKDSTVNIR